MLNKLFKYEFKNTYKIMLVIYALVAGITIYGMLMYSFNSLSILPSDLADTIEGLTIFLYVLALFSMIVITFVYLCVQFYRTMYSDQGYLTHTLPVTPMATFNVKLFTAFIWMMISVLLLFLSVFLLVGCATNWEMYPKLFKSIDEVREFVNMFGFTTITGFCLYLFLTLVISCLSKLLLAFVSFSLGQLFNQHKVAAAIGIYIGLHVVEKILSSMLGLILGNSFLSALTEWFFVSAEQSSMWMPVFLTALLFSMALAAVYYVICIVIVRNHINLD